MSQLDYLKVFLSALALGLLGIVILKRIFLVIKKIATSRLVLEKEGRKVVKIGGVVIFGTIFFFIPLFFYDYFSGVKIIQAIIFCAALIFLLGLFDDIWELRPVWKFLGELFIVSIFLISSGLATEIIFFSKTINILVTFFWIIAITNAFNLLDILDGLATGIGLLISLGFIYLAFSTTNVVVLAFSAIFSGVLLAVLVFNFPPAKIYLGDSGSLLLGFVFSILAILISYARPSYELALFSPILILGFPIYDTGFVVLMRFLKNKPIFVKTNDHFALRLIAKGKKKRAVLFICYSLTSIFIAVGIALTKLQNIHSLILILVTLILFTTITLRIGKVR